MRFGLASLMLALAMSCQNLETRQVPLLGTGRVTADFASYTVRRVGLLPLNEGGEGAASDESMEQALHAELVASTGFEVIPISADDLLEVEGLEPFRRGRYSPAGLIELRRRFLLDAVFVSAISSRRMVPPQRLGLQADLISCETGATLWSGNVLLDAADKTTREALELWSMQFTDSAGGAELVLLSPRRFARFAAWQVMQLL